MKKTLSILLTAMVLSTTACGSGAKETKAPETTAALSAQTETQEEKTTEAAETKAAEAQAEDTEVIVFAAASMTETLNQIAELYQAIAPHVTLTFNFDSSGTLKTQIQEGAECDIFISAGQKQMNQLDIKADASVNTDGLDFVEEGTRINLLENKVILAVPDDNPKNIKTFDDMVAGLKDNSILLAMGNSDVPVGQYTQKILAYYDLNEEELAKAGAITYGTNVKEVTTQVKESTVDCGIIYCTDAFSAELNIADSAAAEMCGQVIYPAAVLKISDCKEEAQAFLDYLKTEDAMNIFESVGFAPAE